MVLGKFINRLFKDSIVYGLGTSILAFYQIILLPIITKYLDSDDISSFIYFASLNAVFVTILIFGMDSATVRFLFDKKDNLSHYKKVFSSGLFFILTISLIFLVLSYYFRSSFFEILKIHKDYRAAFLIMIFGLPFLAIIRYIQNWYKWTLKPINFLIFTSGFVLSNIAALFFLILINKLNFFNIVLSNTLIQLFLLLFGLYNCRKYLTFRIDKTLLKNIILYGLPFALLLLLSSLRSNMDRILIRKYFFGEAEFAIYGIMQRISSILLIFIGTFDVAIAPLIYSTWDTPNASKNYAKIQTGFLFGLTFFCTIFSALSSIIIVLLSNQTYITGKFYLTLLIPTNIIIGLLTFSGLGINYSKKSLYNLLLGIVCIIVYYCSSILTTKYYGAEGLLFSMFLGTFTMIGLGYFISSKYYPIKYNYITDFSLLVFCFIGSFFLINFNLSEKMALDAMLKVMIVLLVFLFLIMFFFKHQFYVAIRKVNSMIKSKK